MRAKKNTNPLLIDVRADLFSQLCNKRNDLEKLKELRTGSNKMVWWVCSVDKDHIWDDSIAHRVGGRGCPYCRGIRVNQTNSLRALGGSAADEFHPTKNEPETLDTLYGHSGKRVWWLCKNGHEWQAAINARIPKSGKDGSGCKKCTSQTSLPEIRIYAELKFIFSDAMWRETIEGIELDVFLPTLRVGIEYDGAFWHKDKLEKDREKNEALKKLGIFVMRVREQSLFRIGEEDVLLDSKLDKKVLDKILYSLTRFVDGETIKKFDDYISTETYQNSGEYNRIVGFLPSPIPEKSLAGLYPDLAKEWDFEANYPLKPENVAPHAGFPVGWICNQGHQFTALISNRTGKTKRTQINCGYCSGRYATPENNFLKLYPELAKEIHPTLNGDLKLEELTPKSNKDVWWKCPNPEHEPWKQKPSVRVGQKKTIGCPSCAGRIVTATNSLVSNFPELGLYWNIEKNGKQFNEVSKGSHDRVEWKCPQCDLEWQLVIKDMVKRLRNAAKTGKNLCLNCRKNEP